MTILALPYAQNTYPGGRDINNFGREIHGFKKYTVSFDFI